MSNYNTDILIENINKLIVEYNLTQAQLGEIIGMSQPNISKALNKNDKKTFTLDQVVGIAKHFNTSVDSLLGNTTPSEINVTPRGTAAFLAELIAKHDAKFADITRQEIIYDPFWDYRENTLSCKVDTKEIPYMAIYLPSYWEVPQVIHDDYDGALALQAEAEQCGNKSRMFEVNKFLSHFKEIFEIYEKNGLTQETYEAVLADMLNRLRDY